MKFNYSIFILLIILFSSFISATTITPTKFYETGWIGTVGLYVDGENLFFSGGSYSSTVTTSIGDPWVTNGVDTPTKVVEIANGETASGIMSYNGALYFGTADASGQGKVWSNKTGTWATTSPPAGYDRFSNFVVYEGKLYMGGGDNAGDGDTFSYDGTSYTKVVESACGNTGTYFVLLGKLYAINGCKAVNIFDNSSWTTGTTRPDPTCSSLVYNDIAYVLYNKAGAPYVQTFDGTTWTTIWTANATYTGLGSIVEYHGKIYIGTNYGAGLGDIYVYDIDTTTTTLAYDGDSYFISSMTVYQDTLWFGTFSNPIGDGDLYYWKEVLPLSITNSTYNMTSDGGCTNWATNNSNNCNTTYDTPTFTFDTNLAANCSVRATQNVSDTFDYNSSFNCSTTGNLTQICTVYNADNLVNGQNYLYASCTDGTTNVTSGPLYINRVNAPPVMTSVNINYLDMDFITGLVDAWNLDGLFPISRSNLNDGTLSGYTFNNGTRQNGQIGSSFNGVDEYVKSSIPISSYPFTLGAWVNISSLTSGAVSILGFSDESSSNIYYSIGYNNDAWRFEARNVSNNGGQTSSTSFDADELVHIVGTFVNDSYRELYINGNSIFVSTNTVGFHPNTDISTISITRLVSPTGYFEGSIYRVNIWNKALNTTEIASDYAVGKDSVTPIGDGLVAQYLLNDTDYSDTSSVYDINQLVKGHDDYSNAYHFDGVDEHVEISNSDRLNLTSSASISYWYKWVGITPSSGAVQQRIYDKSGTYRVELIETSNGRLDCAFPGLSDNYLVGSGSSSQLNTWIHGICMYNGTHTSLYQNGILIISEPSTGNISSGTGVLAIGGIGSRIFNGSISDVRIYNKSLNQSEITTIYEITKLAYSNTLLSCDPASTDADDDIVTYAYQWYNGTTPVATTQNITSNEPLSTYVCEATPFDGTSNGTALNSSGVYIQQNIITLYLELFNKSITAELGSIINVTGNITSGAICLDVNYSGYGTSYDCGTNITSFNLNLTSFIKTVDNQSRTAFNLTYNTTNKNNTFYINAHQFDIINSIKLNLTAFNVIGDFVDGVKFYINNTLANTIGSLISNSNILLTTFSDLTTWKQSNFTNAQTNNVGNFYIPKTANVTNGTLVLKSVTTNNLSLPDTPYVVIEATSIVEAGFTGLYDGAIKEFIDPTDNATKWAFYQNNSDTDAVKRAKIYATLFYGNDGTNPRASSTYITGITGLKTTVARDVNKRAYYFSSIDHYVIDNEIDQIIYNITSAGNDNSVWSNLAAQGLGSDNDVAQAFLYFPTSQLVNSVFKGNPGYVYSNEIGTNREADEADTPTIRFISQGGPGGDSGGYTIHQVILLTEGNISIYESEPDWTLTINNFSTIPAMELWDNFAVNDVWLEIASVDGTREFEQAGVFDTINTTDNFATVINTYLPGCEGDSNGFCNVSVFAYSSSTGYLNISNISINYTNQINPISLNKEIFWTFTNNSNGFVNVPITLEANSNATLQINDIKYDYIGGNDTILITAHDSGYTVNTSYNITYYYSGWNWSMPRLVDYIEFIPRSYNAKNVTPYKQRSITPILNITALNYGGKTFNYSLIADITSSCINVSVSNNNNISQEKQIGNTSWLNISENINYLDNFGLWMWADYNCDQSTWGLYNPLWNFRACCEGCDVCDDDVLTSEVI